MERAWEWVRGRLPEGAATEPGDHDLRDSLALLRVAAELPLDAGDLGAATAWLEAHDRWLAWSGAVLGQSEGQALWARYYRQSGDMARAHRHAECALAYASEPRQPLALLAAHRLLGELDTAEGRYDDAARHLDASLRPGRCLPPPPTNVRSPCWRWPNSVLRRMNATSRSILLDEVRAPLLAAQGNTRPRPGRRAHARLARAPSPAPAYPAA